MRQCCAASDLVGGLARWTRCWCRMAAACCSLLTCKARRLGPAARRDRCLCCSCSQSCRRLAGMYRSTILPLLPLASLAAAGAEGKLMDLPHPRDRNGKVSRRSLARLAGDGLPWRLALHPTCLEHPALQEACRWSAAAAPPAALSTPTPAIASAQLFDKRVVCAPLSPGGELLLLLPRPGVGTRRLSPCVRRGRQGSAGAAAQAGWRPAGERGGALGVGWVGSTRKLPLIQHY